MSNMISPATWLALVSEDVGPRQALQRLLDQDLPDACDDALSRRIVEHFVEQPLALRWDLTPWWQPRKRPTRRWSAEEPIAPDHGREPTVRPTARLGYMPLRAPAVAARARFVSQSNRDLDALYLRYFQAHQALDRVAPEREVPDWVDELVRALTQLEAYWQALLAGADAAEPLARVRAWFACDERSERFRATYEAADARAPLEADEADRIWARRVAVALWSDVHGHWPWRLRTLQPHDLDLLLGFAPESHAILGETPSWSSTPRTFRLGTEAKNGQQFFVAPDGEHLHLGRLWQPDPFLAWHIAYFELAPGQLENGRRSAVMAATRWLRDWPLLHEEGSPKLDEQPKLPFVYDTLLRVRALGRAGCHTNGPLLMALLRAMNVPAAHGITPTYKRVNGRISAHDYDRTGHATIVCPTHDVGLALLHADDVIAHKGQRTADAELAWLPIAEWTLVHLLMPLTAPGVADVLLERAHRQARGALKRLPALDLVRDFERGRTTWFMRMLRLLDGTYDDLVWPPPAAAHLPRDWLAAIRAFPGVDTTLERDAWHAAVVTRATAAAASRQGASWEFMVELTRGFLARADQLLLGKTAFGVIPGDWIALPAAGWTSLVDDVEVVIAVTAFGAGFAAFARGLG